MKFSYSNVQMLGRVTQEPDVRQAKSGTEYARLSVVVNERYKQNDEWQDKPHFFDVTVFGYNAGHVGRQLRKGDQVWLTGRLSQNVYERDGKKIYKTEIIMEDFIPLKKEQRAAQGGGIIDEIVDTFDAEVYTSDDDIPF